MAEFEGLDKLLRRLDQLALDTRRVERPLRAAGAYMLGSIEKNFQQQGRPKKWTPLAPSTIARRRKGKGRGGARILIDKAALKNSMSFRVVGPATEVGTNLIYGRRHHFGYPGGEGRGHSKTPARSFLLVQTEDIREIGEIFSRHVRRR